MIENVLVEHVQDTSMEKIIFRHSPSLTFPASTQELVFESYITFPAPASVLDGSNMSTLIRGFENGVE